MELLLIRHARPFHVVDGDGDGDGADPDLNEDGLIQARRLAGALVAGRHGEVHRLVSSPMRRAHQTAQIVADQLPLPLTVDERLAELDRGWTSYGVDLDGYTDRRLLWADMNSGRLGVNTFDPVAFTERAIAGVEDVIAATDENARAAVVCHGGVINVYLAHILGAPRSFFTQPSYTSVTRIHALANGHREIVSINEADHLNREGLEFR